MRILLTVVVIACMAGCTHIPLDSLWRISADTNQFGVLEAPLNVRVGLTNAHGSTDEFSFSVINSGNQIQKITITTHGGINFPAENIISDGGLISFDIQDGSFRGHWTVDTQPEGEWNREFSAINHAIRATMEQWLYDPRLLNDPEYIEFERSFAEDLNLVSDDFGLIASFGDIWDGNLFSHFEILRPLNTMEGLLDEADSESQENPVAKFELIEPQIALVTIESFFGIAIEKQIDNAMIAAIESGAESLIIDVRNNPGGTTSALPVASRVIKEQAVLGYFLANRWWQENNNVPSLETLRSRPPLNGRPQSELQAELIQSGLVAASLKPANEIFSGAVYVLTNHESGSATEALVGMLKMSGRATLIGETTAGRMLSSTFFPLPHEFSLRVPIADFYLIDGSRIDSVGVSPLIETSGELALETAVATIKKKSKRK